ncbi:hypothetical protein HDU96_004129 [Phlyctochytrium bullatum]|nr:hypothetical protein HDU96_004129 [Phlyctochytrium bullatum]
MTVVFDPALDRDDCPLLLLETAPPAQPSAEDDEGATELADSNTEGGESDDDDVDSSPRLSYIQQWDKVIETVFDGEQHLFSDEQQSVISTFRSLEEDAKELFIKLMMRKIKVERLDKLDFPRINDIYCAADALLEAGFIVLGIDPTDLPAQLGLLTRDELLPLAKHRRIPTTRQTVDAIRLALIASTRQRTLPGFWHGASSVSALAKDVAQAVGRTVRLADAVVAVFHRLFLVHNREREWPDSFFVDLVRTNLRAKRNRLTFPSYTVHRVALTWPTSAALDAYIGALKERRALHDALVGMPKLTPGEVPRKRKREAGDQDGETVEDRGEYDVPRALVAWGEPLLEMCRESEVKWEARVDTGIAHVSGVPWLAVYTEGWVRTRIMEIHAHVCGRLRRNREREALFTKLLAQHLFLQRHRGAWYADLAQLLHTTDRKTEALAVCTRALSDPMVQSGDRRHIEQRAVRLHAALGTRERLEFPVAAAAPECTIFAKRLREGVVGFGAKAVWADDTGEAMGVEELALRHYTTAVGPGWRGHHSESSIITTLFGLLFWDILFDGSVPGVFVSAFQDAPLDLDTEFFMPARAAAVAARLVQIGGGMAPEILAAVDMRERGRRTRCRGVNWKRFERQEVVEVAECFGGEALERICGGFCRSYWAHSGGVPDLCVWNYEEKKVRMVEVKGEGDRLSTQQKVWLEFLLEAKVDVEVLHVMEADKKRGRGSGAGVKKAK